MAMLAERKRKVKWALNPRGKQWSEDSNKFGQKLLEKMGWTSGKGLGVNESGITEHIKVAFKNDSQGIGYKLRDDQWTQHEDQFNSLLSSLNGESIVKNDTQVEEEVTSCSGFGFKDKNKETVVKELSGESLEDKSKKSKARVHYKKFTRGKDISRYSEKDLANIFGKKVDDIKTEENKTVSNVESDPPKATEDNEKKDFSFGITTIETKLSISDYFKSKMPIKKTNKYIVGSDGVLKTLKEENVNNDQEIDTFRPSFNLNEKISKEEESVRSTEHEITSEFDRQDGFRPSFNLEQTESSCNVTNKVENHNSKGAITENPDTNMEENTAYKKNKKIKKSKEDVMDVIPDPKEIIEFDQNSNDCKIVKKKKKKDKKSKSTKSNADNGMDNEESKTVTSEDTTDGLEVQNKGKQKNIVKHNILDGELLINGDVENVLETADKSKKKKKKHVFQNNEINENISKDESVLNVAECTSNILSDNCNKKNKKNKNKDISLDEEIIVHSEKEQNNINTIDKGIDSCINKKKSKKNKKKKSKEYSNEAEEIPNMNENDVHEEPENKISENDICNNNENTDKPSKKSKKKKKTKCDNEVDSREEFEENNLNIQDINNTHTSKEKKRKFINDDHEQNTIHESPISESPTTKKLKKDKIETNEPSDEIDCSKKTSNDTYSNVPKKQFDKKLFAQRQAERLDRKMLKEKLRKVHAQKGTFISKSAFSGSNLLKLPGYC